MGRPLPKKFFGDPVTNPGGQILFRGIVDSGTGEEDVYITAQKGNGKFDVTGVTSGESGRVTLVDNTSPSLGEGYLRARPFGVGDTPATAGAIFFQAVSVAIANGGAGHAVNDVIQVIGSVDGNPVELTVSSVDGNGSITGVSITDAGSLEGVPATVLTQDATTGSGTDAAFELDYGVESITVASGGANYTGAPTPVITDDYGTGTVLNATIAAGAVATITVTNPGSGYRQFSQPTVIVPPQGGTLEFVRNLLSKQIKTYEGNTYVWKRDGEVAQQFGEADLENEVR